MQPLPIKRWQKRLGLTPTLPAGYIDDTHVVMTKQTHLNFLADVFDMHDGIYSAGDGLIYLGEWFFGFAPFIWVFESIRRLSAKQ